MIKRRRVSAICRQNTSTEAVNSHIFFFRATIQKFRRRQLRYASSTSRTMPPSQLKQLKSSLRETGVLGPQQSKKQKRQNAKSGSNAQNRNQRNAALQAIRDRFNPFEIKAPAKSAKFDYTSRDGGADASKKASRPGVTKSLGEERVSINCDNSQE